MRKSRLPTCVACSAIALALVGRAARGDATAYQNDPAHDGSVVMSNFNPIPSISWTANIGNQRFVYPLIAGGQVFVSGTNQLLAYNAASGSVNWSVSTNSGNGAAYDNGMIFTNVSTGVQTTEMNAYSSLSGQLIWSTPFPNSFFASAPVTATSGMVYTAGGGSADLVYAVRESDGKAQWSATVENGDGSSPTVTNDAVYVSYEGPHTYKLSAVNGSAVWADSGPFVGGSGDTSVYYNGKLYVSVNSTSQAPFYQLVALNSDTGATAYQSIYGHVSTPAFFNNSGYLALSNQIYGFNTADGSVLWSKTLDGNMTGPPLVINGYVYDETGGGNLFVLNAADGTVIDELNLGVGPAGSFTSSGNYEIYQSMAASDGILAVPVGRNIVVLSLPEPTCMAGLLFAAALILPRKRPRFR